MHTSCMLQYNLSSYGMEAPTTAGSALPVLRQPKAVPHLSTDMFPAIGSAMKLLSSARASPFPGMANEQYLRVACKTAGLRSDDCLSS